MIGQEKTALMVGPGLYLNYYKFPLTVCGGSGSLAKFQGKKSLWMLLFVVGVSHLRHILVLDDYYPTFIFPRCLMSKTLPALLL